MRQLPFGEMKIDRSFVKNMMREDGDHAIVRSTIDLAANLGLTVVAEGVEDSRRSRSSRAWAATTRRGTS